MSLLSAIAERTSLGPWTFQSPKLKLPIRKTPPSPPIIVEEEIVPSERAAQATAGFKVDPGGYSPLTARLKRGRFLSAIMALYSSLLIPRAKLLLSKLGRLTIANTPPFLGSIATAAAVAVSVFSKTALKLS